MVAPRILGVQWGGGRAIAFLRILQYHRVVRIQHMWNSLDQHMWNCFANYLTLNF